MMQFEGFIQDYQWKKNIRNQRWKINAGSLSAEETTDSGSNN